MRYVAIDVETTGLDPSYCQVLEFAAIVDDLRGVTQDASNWFHCYVVHDRVVGQINALVLNAGILETIARRQQSGNFFSPSQAVKAYAEWLRNHGFRAENAPVYAAKNFMFDWSFLSTLPDWTRRIRKKHRHLDPGGLYTRPEIDDVPPGLDECLSRAGIAKGAAHRATDDALAVVRLIRRHYLGEEDWDY